MTRILIADDREIVRFGLRGILEAQPNWEVVEAALTTNSRKSAGRPTAREVDLRCGADRAMPVVETVHLPTGFAASRSQ